MVFCMHLLFVCTTLCLLLLYNASASKAAILRTEKPRILDFSWQNCGSPADPFQIKSFILGPDPLKISGNVTLSVTFNFAIPCPTDTAMIVIMEKKIAWFYIQVPCINNIGSCVYYDMCSYWTEICSAFLMPYSVPCTCPIPAKTYAVSDLTVEVILTLPPEATGGFRIYGNLLSGSVGQLGCLQIDVNLSR